MKNLILIGQQDENKIGYDLETENFYIGIRGSKMVGAKKINRIIVFFSLVSLPLFRWGIPFYKEIASGVSNVIIYLIGILLVKMYGNYLIKKQEKYTTYYMHKFSKEELLDMADRELKNCVKALKFKGVFIIMIVIATLGFFWKSNIICFLFFIVFSFCLYLMFKENTRQRIRILKEIKEETRT